VSRAAVVLALMVLFAGSAAAETAWYGKNRTEVFAIDSASASPQSRCASVVTGPSEGNGPAVQHQLWQQALFVVIDVSPPGKEGVLVGFMVAPLDCVPSDPMHPQLVEGRPKTEPGAADEKQSDAQILP